MTLSQMALSQVTFHLAKNYLRGNLSPMRLEQQLLLKYNKSFWDLQTVNDVVNAHE